MESRGTVKLTMYKYHPDNLYIQHVIPSCILHVPHDSMVIPLNQLPMLFWWDLDLHVLRNQVKFMGYRLTFQLFLITMERASTGTTTLICIREEAQYKKCKRSSL